MPMVSSKRGEEIQIEVMWRGALGIEEDGENSVEDRIWAEITFSEEVKPKRLKISIYQHTGKHFWLPRKSCTN